MTSPETAHVETVEGLRSLRVLARLLDYPTADEETVMMQRWGQVTKQPSLVPASSGEELLSLRNEVDKLALAAHPNPITAEIVDLMVASARASISRMKPVLNSAPWLPTSPA